MSNWYTTREAVKRAARLNDAERDSTIDRHIEAASRQIDRWTRRRFIPETKTRLYRWPQPQPSLRTVLWLDADLLSVTTLQSEAQNSSPTTISSSDYFLEPNNSDRYNRIEIDLSSTATFSSGDTPQRSISVAGSWGYGNTTRTVTEIASGINTTSSTTLVVNEGSQVHTGHTILAGSEQVFLSDRSFAAMISGTLLDGALTATESEVTVTVDASHGIIAGEVIRIDSEEMLVLSVSTNDLTVVRHYNGTVLAAHADNTAIFINRTFTVERAVNGTTAEAHLGGGAVSIAIYEPPYDVQNWALAEALAMYMQEQSGWGRTIGQGDGVVEMSATGLKQLRESAMKHYRRGRIGVI